MKEISKNEQIAILEKTYITKEDVYKVLPIGKNYSSKIFNEIEQELKEMGVSLFNTRPRVIPTEYLLKKYPNLKKVRNNEIHSKL